MTTTVVVTTGNHCHFGLNPIPYIHHDGIVLIPMQYALDELVTHPILQVVLLMNHHTGDHYQQMVFGSDRDDTYDDEYIGTCFVCENGLMQYRK